MAGPSEAFAVPFRHRLVFTADVFGADAAELAAVLEPSGDLAPKVQFWVDGHVAAARPGLRRRIDAFLVALGDRVRPAGVFECVGGEAVKNDFGHVERVLAAIHAADLDRRSYVVVVGGGAVLDAVGFAAATAHRGIRLVRLPTTTLAQADSGVGVKNAVNKFGQKNWLGTFAVPWAVVNDTALLASLPDREFAAGFSEAVKVALLKSPAGFADLERDAARIRARDPAAALPAIRAAALAHLTHITRGGDPFEALEARPLDYGHWSAHRMESADRVHVAARRGGRHRGGDRHGLLGPGPRFAGGRRRPGVAHLKDPGTATRPSDAGRPGSPFGRAGGVPPAPRRPTDADHAAGRRRPGRGPCGRYPGPARGRPPGPPGGLISPRPDPGEAPRA